MFNYKYISCVVLLCVVLSDVNKTFVKHMRCYRNKLHSKVKAGVLFIFYMCFNGCRNSGSICISLEPDTQLLKFSFCSGKIEVIQERSKHLEYFYPVLSLRHSRIRHKFTGKEIIKTLQQIMYFVADYQRPTSNRF